VAEDLGEEDVIGLVFEFELELVATDGAVGAAEVAGFPRQVEGAEGGGHVLGGALGPVVVLTAAGEGKLLTGLQHLKNVSGCKTGTYGNAKTLWHYIFARIGRFLGQLSQRGGCGDSGRP
jgi:hypothetical protein